MDDDQLIQLTIERDQAPAETTRLAKQIIKIGSSRWSDVRIDDPAVSGTHARLINAGGRPVIEDRRSDLACPETMVNGVSIFGNPRPIASGDTISIGPVRIRVAFGAGLPAVPAEPLAPPPRAVPLRMVFAELFASSSWFALGTYVFILSMIAMPPLGLWESQPWLFPPVASAALAVVAGVRIARVWKRVAILRWGKVARVLAVQSDSTNTSWSGVAIPVAHGWEVDRGTYNGMGYRNVVKYSTDVEPEAASEPQETDYRTAAPHSHGEPPYEGAIVVKGRKFQGGVILYDVRNPASALCVDAYASDLHRDARGQLVGHLRPGNWIAAFALSLVTAGWLAMIATPWWHVFGP